MARKSKSKSNLRSNGQRHVVNTLMTSHRLLDHIVRSQSQMLLDRARLTGSNNRSFSPVPHRLRTPRLASGRKAYSTVQKNVPLRIARYQFEIPKQTVVCVRRGVRKEVLHALRKTGKGSGRPRRFNSNSRIKC